MIRHRQEMPPMRAAMLRRLNNSAAVVLRFPAYHHTMRILAHEALPTTLFVDTAMFILPMRGVPLLKAGPMLKRCRVFSGARRDIACAARHALMMACRLSMFTRLSTSSASRAPQPTAACNLRFRFTLPALGISRAKLSADYFYILPATPAF